MCLIVLAVNARADAPLVFAANRDELHARPTVKADWWTDHPNFVSPTGCAAEPRSQTSPLRSEVFGGRDLEKGGTWLAVTKSGRLAAVTNHRLVRPGKPLASHGPSRGFLVRDFVFGSESARAYVERRRTDGYESFNLVVWDGDEAWALGDDASPRRLERGVHGLSNARVDDPWPKVKRTKRILEQSLSESRDHMVRALFDGLADRTGAPDADLPDTGVGLELERRLAPPFIVSPVYGTRSTSVVVIGTTDLSFEERSFDSSGAPSGVAALRWDR
jgi:uncharacterized protein with NRDE domain